jgi:hypothetical protein
MNQEETGRDDHKIIFDIDPSNYHWEGCPTFSKGQKIYLELDVEDPLWSRTLVRWLYGKVGEEKRQYRLFGCTLNQIWFHKPNNSVLDNIEESLENLLNQIKEFKKNDR